MIYSCCHAAWILDFFVFHAKVLKALIYPVLVLFKTQKERGEADKKKLLLPPSRSFRLKCCGLHSYVICRENPFFSLPPLESIVACLRSRTPWFDKNIKEEKGEKSWKMAKCAVEPIIKRAVFLFLITKIAGNSNKFPQKGNTMLHFFFFFSFHTFETMATPTVVYAPKILLSRDFFHRGASALFFFFEKVSSDGRMRPPPPPPFPFVMDFCSYTLLFFKSLQYNAVVNAEKIPPKMTKNSYKNSNLSFNHLSR